MVVYYNKDLKTNEIIILAIIILLLVLLFTSLKTGILSSIAIQIFFLLIGLLSISFLLPTGLIYAANIDMGKIKNLIFWLIPVLLLAFGFEDIFKDEQVNYLTKIPLLLFCYLHLMRIFYFMIFKQPPGYGGGWFREGEVDKFSNNIIKKNDSLFNALHGFIPIGLLICWIWISEVVK